MRPLDEKETTVVFEKLFKFTGPNLKHLINLVATSISRHCLASLGTSIRKLTKSGAFHLTVHCLDLLAAHARHKVWLKPASEMTFLYGNSVTKSMLARITENTKAVDGVVIFSMSDLPLGFGVAARSTQDCRNADTNGVCSCSI